MATITGTLLSERINSLGTYYWDGTAWIFLNSAATTSGADIVSAGGGDDEVYGGSGNDRIYGEAGNDILFGGANNDRLRGGDGNDVLYGEAGKDDLDGGAGSDILIGGASVDTLTGGADGDFFVFNAVADSSANSGAYSSSTSDTIAEFTSAAETATVSLQDKIDLRGLVLAIGRPLTWSGTTATSFGVWHTVSGTTTYVNIDTTGDQVADMVIRISSGETLSANDFLGLTGDTTPPTVISAAYGSNDGTLKAGETVTLVLNFSENVTVTGGTPILTLNSGGTATYVGGSGTSALTFSYTVISGQNSSDLAITAIDLNSSVIRDAANNPADLAGLPFNPAGILIVDTAVPAAPTIDLDAASDTGASNSDKLTSDNTPDLSGTAEANAIVQVFDGVTLLGQTTANGSGSWSFTTGVLGNGAHNFTAKATDASGNVGSASTNLAVTIDTIAPAAPTIDNVTSNSTPTLSGTAEANAIVQVFDGVTLLGQATANGSGSWSFTTGVLGNGLHNFTAQATDASGNVGPASAVVAITINSVDPAAPTIDLDAASDTGDSNTDNVTSATTPTLSGTAEANAIVQIFDGVTLLGQTTANGSGSWSFTTGVLGNDVHNFTAKATDASGNQGPASTNLAVTIDTIAPAAPTIDLDAASDTGVSNTDNVTSATTPTLTGTAEANAIVQIFDGATLMGQTTANGSGAWNFTTGTLSNRVHNFTAKAIDASGNVGLASANLAVTVDTGVSSTTQVIEVRVAAASDDAEEVLVTSTSAAAGKMFTTSSDLELINDVDFVGQQLVGIRFSGLNIPVGATITAAWVQFTADETNSEATNLTIKAQASANAASFSTTAFNISGRLATTNAVTWSPQAWTTVGASGTAQQTADLSTLVQEVVALPDWTAGNALAFIISGGGHRTAVAFDSNAATAPLLHVEYTLGGINNIPDAQADFATTQEDTPVVIAALSNDSDLNGDPLSITAVGQAAHGSATIGVNGTIIYIPAANQFGSDSFTYTMSDGNGGTSSATVNVTVTAVNDAPVAIDDLVVTNTDTPVVVNVLANDRDADPDALTITQISSALHGTVSLQAGGSVFYTPIAGFIGVDSFDYTVSDGHGGTDTATATVSVGGSFTPVTFAVIGDYGVDNGFELAVSNLVKSWSPDFIVTVGDNIYGSQNTPDNAIGKYYSDYIGDYNGIYGAGSETNRFFPVLGNHDWSDAGLEAYLDYFTLPESSSGNERYYDFIMGPIQFFMLDADLNEPDGISANSAQAQWLQEGLANSVTPWQIVVGHMPPYSSGAGHGSEEIMQWPYEEWGADTILSGHDHIYERILKDENIDGTVLPYFVAGTGGAGLYDISNPSVADSVVQYNSNYGAMLVTATNTEITFEFWSITNSGTLVDSFTILTPDPFLGGLLLG